MQYKNILVTGGAGFIGANFIEYLFNQKNFNGNIINLDKLTYASNLNNLQEIKLKYNSNRYFFEKIDICDMSKIKKKFEKYNIDAVCHFAAESHVDRSISNPAEFINTNINGTFNLLEAARIYWGNNKNVHFHHISSDEVYGSLGKEGSFYETTPYQPRSPYSASKAASDHLVMSYFHTFDLPVTISNCSNNYGKYQNIEKLIPLVITKALKNKSIPVYGDGSNIRDWLYVQDHCSAIYAIMNKGIRGESYNIGGEYEISNIDLIKMICAILDKIKPNKKGSYSKLITFVKDRLGHDKRYAINCDKIKKELNWKRSIEFKQGLEDTVNWYLNKNY